MQEATRDIIRGLGFEPVDVEISRVRGQLFVRLLIGRDAGVSLEDCAAVSNLVGKVLEREEVLEVPYVLEVMSPGLDRPLKRPEDFSASTGKRVKVKLRQPFEGRRSYSGILMDAGEDSFTLELGPELMELRYEAVLTVRLDPELPW